AFVTLDSVVSLALLPHCAQSSGVCHSGHCCTSCFISRLCTILRHLWSLLKPVSLVSLLHCGQSSDVCCHSGHCCTSCYIAILCTIL
ncbi:hypothetical protein NDU88_009168, partial [Pleurodeles waltl]